jgi:hypothetical protein
MDEPREFEWSQLSPPGAGQPRSFAYRMHLWAQAVSAEPFYRFGEVGTLLFNVGKSILEGAILYTMFSMAESEYKVAAIMGVVTKYTYPGIVVISNANVSSFIDHVEKIRNLYLQVQKLIRGLFLVGVGEALGAILLVLCFPPFFEATFGFLAWKKYILIVLYLFHHLCSGTAQIIEGRIWFRMIEIKIRHGQFAHFSGNFWGIYAMSVNMNLVVSMIFLWGTTAVIGFYYDNLAAPLIVLLIAIGLMLALLSKFLLPLAWHFKLRNEQLES